MAVGDRYDGVHLAWRDWYGGAHPTSHGRACVGTIEHIGLGQVLIRRPRGSLLVKRMTMAICWDGRLSARHAPDTENLLHAWCAHDSRTRSARDHRTAAARQQRAQHEAAYLAACEVLAAAADECPY